MTHSEVLLDTSFFIRLLNSADPLCKNAEGYFQYFLTNKITMVVSTISIAEFCVIGVLDQLPLSNLIILPFNLHHATRTGEFAKCIFRNKNKLKLNERNIIPNDTKLFAQADTEESIEYYLSSDTESSKIYNQLSSNLSTKFQFIDLNIPYGSTFGVLEMG